MNNKIFFPNTLKDILSKDEELYTNKTIYIAHWHKTGNNNYKPTGRNDAEIYDASRFYDKDMLFIHLLSGSTNISECSLYKIDLKFNCEVAVNNKMNPPSFTWLQPK